MMHSAEREHLRTVFCSHYMSNLFSLTVDRSLFRADIAIGINFDFITAVTENAFRYHRYHIHFIMFAGNDKRRRFIIRICSSGSNCSRKNFFRIKRNVLCEQRSIPLLSLFSKWYEWLLLSDCFLGENHGIHAFQFPVDVAVTIAGTGFSCTDSAQNRTGIAIDFFHGYIICRRISHYFFQLPVTQ